MRLSRRLTYLIDKTMPGPFPYPSSANNNLIPNGIKKVETRQEGRINNLSSSAKSEVSPVLLINDNDVKASHGAALGAYNPDALFYLTSRGISIEESQKLIIKGTLSPIINKLHDESLIKEVNDFFRDRKL